MQDLKERISYIKRLDKSARILALLLCLVLLLAIGILVGFFSAFFNGALFREGMSFGLLLRSGFGTSLIATLVLFLLAVIIIFLAYTRKLKINNVESTDDKGVSYLEKSTYGSARWMSDEEARNLYDVSKDSDDLINFIFGKLRSTGEVVAYKPPKNGRGNKNVVVVGKSGAGKSWSIVGPEILQSIKRGNSIVVSDPKLELFSLYSSLLKSQGYDVKVLNVVDPEWSDAWDCLKEVVSQETGRLDDRRLKAFVRVYLKNASDNNKEDFWAEGASNILQCMIARSAYKHEKFILNCLMDSSMQMYSDMGIADQWLKDSKGMADNKMCDLTVAEAFFRQTAKRFGLSDQDVQKILQTIEENAPEFSIGSVFHDIVFLQKEGFKTLETEINAMPPEHIAAISYINFAGDPSASDRVKGDTVRGVALKLNAFTNKTLRTALSNTGIILSDINKKLCAYFVVPAEDGGADKPIISTFFEFLLMDAKETWDDTDARCKEQGTNTESVLKTVSIILDEFYSLGEIPIFPSFISKCRSRRLNVTMFLQSISFLFLNYGELQGEGILACCDTLLYMGSGKDPKTADYMANYIMGHATMQTQSRMEENRLLLNGSPDALNISEAGRSLMYADELEKYDRGVIVQVGGNQPLDLDLFPYTEHKLSKRLTPCSIKTVIKPMSRKYPYGDIFSRQEADQEDEPTRTNKVLELVRKLKEKDIPMQIEEETEETIIFFEPKETDIIDSTYTESTKKTVRKGKKEAVPSKKKNPERKKNTEKNPQEEKPMEKKIPDRKKADTNKKNMDRKEDAVKQPLNYDLFDE